MKLAWSAWKVRENFPFRLDNRARESDKEAVPFELRFWRRERAPATVVSRVVEVAGRSVPVVLVRNRRARRYVLRAGPNQTARVTVPRGGSAEEALRFVQRQKGWLEKQFQKLAERPIVPVAWGQGTEVMLRGDPMRLEVAGMAVRLGAIEIAVPAAAEDLRPYVQRELWRRAIPELTARTVELAMEKGFEVRRVSVRNQRSRWGSCSRRGTISLNWRLIQVPEFVRDYIILHELAHLREMKHSRRYWRVVEELCPRFREAEEYLRKHSGLLR